jgi:hypothetical protein
MFICKKAPLAAAAALVVVGLAGCFGGGGDDAPAATPTAGKMVDGPVKGATVVCESVAVNGKVDAGEATTTSNADGTYSFANCNSPVAGLGGVNVVAAGTEYPFKGVLKTPAGAKVMTPLTGLLVGSNLTMAQLAKMLGLEGVDLTQADPTDANNVALLKMTLVVQQLVADMADAIVAGGGAGLDMTAIYAQVSSALATALTTAAANNITLITSSGVNASVLSSFTSELAKVAQANGATVDIGAALTTAANNAKALNDAKDLTALLNVAKDKQAGSNFFTLTGNTVEFVQTPLTSVKSVTVADLAATGVEVSSLNKFAIAVGVDGKPVVGQSAVALNLVEVNGSGRALTAMIDKVTFALNASNQLSLTVPADATVHVYGKKGDASHTEVSASFKMGDNQGTKVVRVESNKLTIDYSGLVDRMLTSTSITQKDVTEYWQNIQGTFTVTAAISNLDLRKSDKTALVSTKVDVKNISGGLLGSVSGVGFTGNVTIKAAQ